MGWKCRLSHYSHCEGAPRLISECTAGLVEPFPSPTVPHLSDGAQQLPVAEHDH